MIKQTLTLSCKDSKGLIAKITSFIFENGGNIITLDQYTDIKSQVFFMRVEWEAEKTLNKEDSIKEISNFFLKNKIDAQFDLYLSTEDIKMAIFVSKFDHCLYDVLLRYKAKEFNCKIPLIISNHPDLKGVAENFGIEYFYFPVNKNNKKEIEKKQSILLKQYNIDFVVLARYMQILTPNFLNEFPNKIINIHHSFLPAFKGAKPYQQAFEQGVKIIGATSHFITERLDQGPIICQDTIAVTHEDTINNLIIKGKDIEKKVLTDAIKLFIDHRIFVHNKRTIIL